jgi:hypothetical protein
MAVRFLGVATMLSCLLGCSSGDNPYSTPSRDDFSRNCTSAYLYSGYTWWLDSEYTEIPARAVVYRNDYSVDSTPGFVRVGWYGDTLFVGRAAQGDTTVDTVLLDRINTQLYLAGNRYVSGSQTPRDTTYVCVTGGNELVFRTLTFGHVDDNAGGVLSQRVERTYRYLSQANPYWR